MAVANARSYYNMATSLMVKRLVIMGKMGVGEMYKRRDYVFLAVDMFVEQSSVQFIKC